MAQTPVIVNSPVGAPTIEYRATADKTAGDVVLVGTVPMVVKRDIDYSEEPLGTVTDGRGDVDWLMPQKAEVITAGNRVYWDATGNPYGGTGGSGAVTAVANGYPIGIAAPSQPNGTNATAATDKYIRVIPNCTDVAPGSSGTTGTTFTVDSDSSTPKIALQGQSAGTGNFTTTIRPEATLSANTYCICPETANGDVLMACTLAQTVAGVKTFSGGITMSGAAPLTFTGTTGQCTIVLTADKADALSIVNGVVADIMVFKTTTSAVEIDIAKEVVLKCGDFAGSYATGSSTVFTAAITKVGAFYAESTGDLTSAYNCRTVVARHLIVTSSGTVNHETYGLVGQCCVKNTTLGHLHAGVMGTLEVSTAATVNGSYTYGAAGVIARLGCGTSILTATKAVCGFSAFYNGEALASGSSVAYACDKVGTANWTYLLAANGCDNLFYASAGSAYEHGVKIASITDVGGATHACSGLARVKVGSTLYYIPLYAAGQVTGE